MKKVLMIEENYNDKEVVLVSKSHTVKVMSIDDLFVPKDNGHNLLERVMVDTEVSTISKELYTKSGNKNYYVIKYNPNVVILDESMLDYTIY